MAWRKTTSEILDQNGALMLVFRALCLVSRVCTLGIVGDWGWGEGRQARQGCQDEGGGREGGWGEFERSEARRECSTPLGFASSLRHRSPPLQPPHPLIAPL